MRRTIFLFILCLVSLSSLAFGQFCDCEIPTASRQSRIAAAEQALAVAPASESQILAKHFPFGVPKPAPDAFGETMLLQLEWITWYDNDLRVPLWVGYELNKEDAKAKLFPRQDCFRRDSRLSDEFASFCEDYKEKFHDRGHMVPANDSRRNQAMEDNSFLFSNMVPQRGNFNRLIWENLESRVNAWAEKVGVFIITGSVFDSDGDGNRDLDISVRRLRPRKRVAIPTHFYKIVFHVREDGKFDTISFLLPHNNRKFKNKARYLKSKIASIDDIEKVTGTNFFPDIEPARQEAMEKAKAESLIKWVTN